jgi:hypothetical protein
LVRSARMYVKKVISVFIFLLRFYVG